MKRVAEYDYANICLFPIRNGLKQGDTLSPLLLSFALEHVIRRVQVNQDGLKLNGTHPLLVYADGVNVLGGSVQDSRNIKSDIISFERAEQFKYLGSVLTNENSVQEEIKSR